MDSSAHRSNLSPLKQALLALEEMEARLAESERGRTEPIAIIGMGCRFPGAENPASFWRLLHNGEDAVREIPSSRWKIDDYYNPDPDAPGKMSTRWGGFLDGVDRFDPEFFGISPREAVAMDPQQRLLLEVAWEALENAGQGPAHLKECQTGVFVGMTSDEYAQLFHRQNDLSVFNAYFASGVARSVAGGRISYTLGIQGPNLSIDTACSSSLVAVHMACLHLRMGECRMALAGGANVILSPEIGIAFSKAHMLAADGRCKTFDARADGFVRSEGCGLVVLKRLSDAVADGDSILALIRGSAVNQDGRSSGLTVPNRSAQEAVIARALASGRVQPQDVGYVEAHGTGTELGDPIEARALANVLGRGRPKETALVVGSVKTNLGHLESAAGIAGLIKTVLALQHQEIPPNLHFESMNPHIDWGGMPVEIPVQPRPWLRGEKRRIAGVSAFGFSGTNAHVVLEEAPLQALRQCEIERPLHILALSARTETALRNLGDRYADLLSDTSRELCDICHSANTGRMHFQQRLCVTGESAEGLRVALLRALPGARSIEREGIRPVFLFPGQGAQYVGMGAELYRTQPLFRSVMDECAELLKPELDLPLLEVLWGEHTHALHETSYTQPALFAIEYSLAALWRSWGVEPAAVLGHSVGEYVAACVAGVLSLADGLKLIAARARLMQSVSGRGAMAAVMAGESRVRDALMGLEARVSIAAFNAPENLVISGYEQELAIAEERLRSGGIPVKRLHVSHAFHSPQMAEIENAFTKVASEVRFAAPQLQLISSLTGEPVGREEMSRPEYWSRQIRQPVRFQQAVEQLRSYRVFVEAGPGTTLSGLGREAIGEEASLWVTSFRKDRGEWPQMLESLSRLYVRGADIDWRGFDEPYQRRKVALPTYPFERGHYWLETKPPQAEPHPPLSDAVDHGLQTASFDQWFYRIAWHEEDIRTEQAQTDCRSWFILPDQGGVAEALALTLRAAGCSSVIVRGLPGELARALEPADAASIGIVDLRSLGLHDGAVPEGAVRDGAAEAPCLALVKLVQEVAQKTRPGVRLWIVTQGAQATGRESASIFPWQAPLWGMARTLATEQPYLWGGIVDLDPSAQSTESAEMLWRQIASFDGEDQCAFRGGRRLVARLEREPISPASAPQFRADAAYLITGGFGGLGPEIARWMVRHGARRLILMGRTPLPPRQTWSKLQAEGRSGGAISTILELEKLGAAVHTAFVDVGDPAAVRDFFHSYQNECWPPIRGVLHAAGALRHALVTETTLDDLRASFQAKVHGAWLLHEALEKEPLDFFITFSSASSVLSSYRLGAYAASNSFLDALAEHRVNRGLPALSVSWGVWSEAGMAARGDGATVQTLSERGMSGMKTEEGLQCLGRLIGGANAHVCVMPVDWQKWIKMHPAYMAKPFFSQIVDGKLALSNEAQQSETGRMLLKQLENTHASTHLDILRDFVQALAKRVLEFSPDRWIDPQQPLNELGMDSLMALEFRNALVSAIGRTLPATLLFNHPAIEDIAAYLNAALGGNPIQADSCAALPDADRNALDKIEELSDEEVSRILAQKLGAVQ